MPRIKYGANKKPSELAKPADKDSIPKEKVAAFVKLIDAMSVRLGSVEAACRYADVHSGHIYNARQGQTGMSIGIAKKILDAHKRLKAN